MRFGLFSDYIKHYTSDHTYQKATVESYSKTGAIIKICGMTWNMLNRCHGKSDIYKFSNNPFNFDEVDAGYNDRKTKQLQFIKKQIQRGGLDFIVLQEVDIFTGKTLPEFVSDFLIKVHSQNWGMVHSTQADDLTMPLLILYNKATLDFVSQKAVFPRDADGKKCALEATFKDKNAAVEVCIVNMHLDYQTDHSAAILAYQQQQIADGKLTVIAGDTNHKDRYYNLAGDKLVPTNIANPDTDQSLTGAELLQRIDGFMASPAHSDAIVTIIDGECGYFAWAKASTIKTFLRPKRDGVTPDGKYVFKVLNPAKAHLGGHVAHQSQTGAPYVNPTDAHRPHCI